MILQSASIIKVVVYYIIFRYVLATQIFVSDRYVRVFNNLRLMALRSLILSISLYLMKIRIWIHIAPRLFCSLGNHIIDYVRKKFKFDVSLVCWRASKHYSGFVFRIFFQFSLLQKKGLHITWCIIHTARKCKIPWFFKQANEILLETWQIIHNSFNYKFLE